MADPADTALARIEQALIDLTTAVEDANGKARLAAVERTLSALETGLAELVSKNTDLTPLVEAIRKIRVTPAAIPAPVVNVTAVAAPAQVHLMSQPWTELEVRVPSLYNGEDRVMTIKRIN